MEMVGELVGVGLREWLEQHYIKQLERVRKGLTLRVVPEMISDEFDSFLTNPESLLFVAGDPGRLCRVGWPSGWASP
jgi:hypothetical protein